MFSYLEGIHKNYLYNNRGNLYVVSFHFDTFPSEEEKFKLAPGL